MTDPERTFNNLIKEKFQHKNLYDLSLGLAGSTLATMIKPVIIVAMQEYSLDCIFELELKKEELASLRSELAEKEKTIITLTIVYDQETADLRRICEATDKVIEAYRSQIYNGTDGKKHLKALEVYDQLKNTKGKEDDYPIVDNLGNRHIPEPEESQKELWDHAQLTIKHGIGTYSNDMICDIARWAREALEKEFVIHRKK